IRCHQSAGSAARLMPPEATPKPHQSRGPEPPRTGGTLRVGTDPMPRSAQQRAGASSPRAQPATNAAKAIDPHTRVKDAEADESASKPRMICNSRIRLPRRPRRSIRVFRVGLCVHSHIAHST
ncbi:MAG: hypothetical protein ACK58T_13370, partial [Phycisphaerae bacterium]